MSIDYTPHGIADAKAREPVGAAVKLGRKGARGAPVEKDHFHIDVPYAGKDQRSEWHPRFGWWNEPPAECRGPDGYANTKSPAYIAWASKRRSLRGIIAHGSWDECLWQSYSAHTAKDQPVPPDKRPWCRGDGIEALRFIGERGTDDWRTIRCPGERCQFRMERPGYRPECKWSSLFLFRLSFSDDLMTKHAPPTPVVRYASGGRRTFESLMGLRESLDKAAAQLGIVSYSPAGFRFTMTCREHTSQKDGGRNYPVIDVSPDESAIDFLLAARTRRQQLLGAVLGMDDVREGALAIAGPVMEGT